MAITQKSAQAALSSQFRPFRVMLSRRLVGQRRRRRRPVRGQKQKKGPAAAAEKKIVYMFMNVKFRGPVTQALYAVDLSSSSYGTCQLEEVKKDPLVEQSPSLYPVVEFYFGDYPVNMSCVMLGSKLYFFGGFYTTLPGVGYTLSKKVYYIDTAKHPLLPTSSSSDKYGKTLDAKSLLVKDVIPDMWSIKPHCYGFSARGKLYVIGDDIDNCENEDYPQTHKVFEFYDPARPDLGWTPLPRPPTCVDAILVDGSVVIDKKVVFLTGEGILSFHLDNLVWTYINTGPLVLCPDAYGPAKVVLLKDQTAYAYWNAHRGVVSIGPVLNVEKDLVDYYRGRSASGEFSDHLKLLWPKGITPTSGIHHLGKDVFCYVMVGFPPNPDSPENLRGKVDGDTFVCSIIVFKFPTYPLPAPEDYSGLRCEPLPTPTQVLHTKRFSCRITKQMDLRCVSIVGSFLAPPPLTRNRISHGASCPSCRQPIPL